VKDAGDKAVVGVTDRDRTEVGKGVRVFLREEEHVNKVTVEGAVDQTSTTSSKGSHLEGPPGGEPRCR
jgi:hypothetical protein